MDRTNGSAGRGGSPGMRVPRWARFAALFGLGLVLAFVENWILWGFFVSRPSLERELQEGDLIVAFSMLKFTPRPTALLGAERNTAADRVATFCRLGLNECLEGRLVLRLEKLASRRDLTADVGAPMLHAAWEELAGKGWFPRVRDPAYPGRPLSGLAILFRKPHDREYLLMTYVTSEIANDHHAYSEALFSVSSFGPALVKQVHFFLDIAGMEGFEWPLLWPINIILLLPLWALISVDRLRHGIGRILYRTHNRENSF
jgi:hypothetical protein